MSTKIAPGTIRVLQRRAAQGDRMAHGVLLRMGQASASPANPNVGQPQQGTRLKKSDQRFRSFAERWMVARCHLFSADQKQLQVDTWQEIQNAKRAYNMAKEVGRNIDPEDEMGLL